MVELACFQVKSVRAMCKLCMLLLPTKTTAGGGDFLKQGVNIEH